MRPLLLCLALAALGACGDESTTTSSSGFDMPVLVLDLSTPGLLCGANVCAGSCGACVTALGLCAPPCKLAAPACQGGATCRPAVPTDGGDGTAVTFGGSCGGYDGVCL